MYYFNSWIVRACLEVNLEKRCYIRERSCPPLKSTTITQSSGLSTGKIIQSIYPTSSTLCKTKYEDAYLNSISKSHGLLNQRTQEILASPTNGFTKLESSTQSFLARLESFSGNITQTSTLNVTSISSIQNVSMRKSLPAQKSSSAVMQTPSSTMTQMIGTKQDHVTNIINSTIITTVSYTTNLNYIELAMFVLALILFVNILQYLFKFLLAKWKKWKKGNALNVHTDFWNTLLYPTDSRVVNKKTGHNLIMFSFLL